MKKILTATLATLLFGALASAQGWETQQSGTSATGGIHESYITNDWFDNWYIGAAGGIITNFSSINDPRIAPEFEVNLLKWFTPNVGVRFGYQGQWGKEYISGSYNPYQINHSALPFDGEYGGPGTLSYGLFYIHGDLMLNLHNTFGGYNHDRVWNCSPYLNFGYMKMYDNQDGAGYDREIGFGLGLYNTFRLSERWVATADLRHVNTASRYKTADGVRTNFLSLSVGVAYNIYRTYWNRTSTVLVEAAAAKETAEAAVAEVKRQEEKVVQLEQQVEQQQEQIEEQREVIDESSRIIEVNNEELKLRAAAANQVVYYQLDSDVLSNTEKYHLRNYVRAQLEAQPDHVFYLTGSADKGTGTMEHNVKLSASRAHGVKSLLMSEFGVKEENIVIKATVVSDKESDAALDRCVLIESK